MHVFQDMAAMAILVVASLLVTVHGHMIMANPTPYGYQTIDNSPLDSSGANYPCKVTSDAATFYSQAGIDNTYAAGSSQTLSFKGSAVHGGGSCQLAITNDMQPSANTDWRVIMSIESGCPTTDGTNPSTYNWTVPADLEPGKYSFAWTWISKLAGQPEFYMNCAPITVTASGSSSSTKARRDTSSYPEMFVANLNSINSCKTSPGTDPVYPDPGENVQKLLTGATPSFATITQSGCVPLSQTQGSSALAMATAGGSGGGGGASSSSAAGSVTTSAPGSSSVTSSASSSSTTGLSGGVFVTSSQAQATTAAPTTFATSTAASSSSDVLSVYVSPVTPSLPVNTTVPALSSSSSMSTTVSTSVSTTSTSAAATATVTGSGSGSGSGSSNSTSSGSGAATKSGTCTQEGMFNCVGSQYQQCASGSWTAMQALPAGTTCQQGESTGLWARDVRTNFFGRRMHRLRKGGN